jgi:dethiobiotin synthetase
MKGIFITGTDTGVGKTLVTGYLARYLLEHGHSAITQKWVQTGSGPGVSSDIARHWRLMKVKEDYVKGYLVAQESIKPH